MLVSQVYQSSENPKCREVVHKQDMAAKNFSLDTKEPVYCDPDIVEFQDKGRDKEII